MGSARPGRWSPATGDRPPATGTLRRGMSPATAPPETAPPETDSDQPATYPQPPTTIITFVNLNINCK